MTLMKTNVVIRDLLGHIVQDAACEAKVKGLDLRLELDDKLPACFETDKCKLNQILDSLLHQAIERGGKGTITLSVGADNEDGSRLLFKVEDTGQVLDSQMVNGILDSTLSAAHWTQDELYARVGLLLRMSSRLVSVLGGRLVLEGSGEAGTCFAFTLPALVKASPAETKPVAAAAMPTSGAAQETKTMTILLVDDVEENRTLLEVLLKKMGYVCGHSVNGQDAVEQCEQKKFDLILMDIQMPVMNGFDAIRGIRAGGVNTTTPIIAMTASGQKGDDLRALDAGGNDCLSKPVDRRKLERKVWRQLAQVRQLRDADAGKEIISFLEGDPDYQKAIETFVSNLPEKVNDMKAAFEKQDLKDLAFKAHALKGLGGFAGFPVFTEKAKQLEDTLKEADLEKIRLQIDEMIQLCMRTKLKGAE